MLFLSVQESVVFLKRSYGHTLSSELADKVCTLLTLQRVELKDASFREVFYMVFEKEAQKSRVRIKEIIYLLVIFLHEALSSVLTVGTGWSLYLALGDGENLEVHKLRMNHR